MNPTTTGFKTVKVSLSSVGQDGIISQVAIDAAKRLMAMKMTRALDAELDHIMTTGALDRISPESTDIIAEYRIIVDDEDMFDDSIALLKDEPENIGTERRPCICPTGGWFDFSGQCINCGGFKKKEEEPCSK